jgi:hypothetical protein
MIDLHETRYFSDALIHCHLPEYLYHHLFQKVHLLEEPFRIGRVPIQVAVFFMHVDHERPFAGTH